VDCLVKQNDARRQKDHDVKVAAELSVEKKSVALIGRLRYCRGSRHEPQHGLSTTFTVAGLTIA
jgi:hypothetical protein